MVNLQSIRDIHRLIQNHAEERTQHLTKDGPTKPEQWDEIYTYLKALTNLYGVVPIDKVTEIFNAHHDQQIDSGDLRYIDYDERSKVDLPDRLKPVMTLIKFLSLNFIS